MNNDLILKQILMNQLVILLFIYKNDESLAELANSDIELTRKLVEEN